MNKCLLFLFLLILYADKRKECVALLFSFSIHAMKERKYCEKKYYEKIQKKSSDLLEYDNKFINKFQSTSHHKLKK